MPSVSSGSAKVFFPKRDREEVLAHLEERVDALRELLPVTRVVLFGSYASGRYTAASDIDLLVVYSGEPREDAYRTVRRAVDLRGLEPHVYTEAEAEAVGDTIGRMTRGGVVVYEAGIARLEAEDED